MSDLVIDCNDDADVAHIALVAVVAGEGLRKLAMFTARESFSHIVATEKESDHVLVTAGVYSSVSGCELPRHIINTCYTGSFATHRTSAGSCGR